MAAVGPTDAGRIGGKTRLAGLLGWPVGHSFSPAMHNAAAADLGLDLVYLPLPVRPGDLPAALKGLPALGFVGVNVTVPHKKAIIPLLDEIDSSARAIGAVNTVVIGDRGLETGDRGTATGDYGADPRSPIPDRTLIGFNTDWGSFLGDLKAMGIEVSGRKCLVLGAGGSARAVAYGLVSAGGRVELFARRPEQARELAGDLGRLFDKGRPVAREWSELKGATGTLIVNTTPVGMAPKVDESPWPEDIPLPPGAFVYDLVYNPTETRLVAAARAAGLRACGGLGMLLRQGAESFKMWTGLEPDLNVMARAAGKI